VEYLVETLVADGKLVGNLSYILLIASMAMRDIFWLRFLAILAGLAGAAYAAIWMNNPVGTFWELLFTAVNVAQWLWLLYERRNQNLTPEQLRIKEEVFPLLTMSDYRKLLNSAEEMVFLLGDELLTEGQNVPFVFLVLEGEAAVMIDEKEISRCGGRDFIGEIGFLNNLPASASVRAMTTMKCLVFDAKLMRRMMERSTEFDRGFSVALNSNLAAKLLRRNAAQGA
jgi:CRP-like cAMP-binding protein